MIFVTIGTQEPFDRLIKAVDDIGPQLGQDRIIAQMSDSVYEPRNMERYNFLAPTVFNEYFAAARLIISHAGMGTIISALQMGKPLIVMPRVAKLGEHRNEHQMATAKQMERLNLIYVAYSEEELQAKIIQLLADDQLTVKKKMGNFAAKSLTDSISNFIKHH